MTDKAKITGGLLIISISFLCGLCDRTSDLEYVIQNRSDSDIEVRFFGLRTPSFGFEKKDTTRILMIDESIILFHEEQIGTVEKAIGNTVYFFDSLKIRNIDRQIESKNNFNDLGDWNFKRKDDYNGEYRLIIDNDDF
jgi:hypothetical protein